MNDKDKFAFVPVPTGWDEPSVMGSQTAMDALRDLERQRREVKRRACGFVRCKDADGKVAYIKAEKIAAVYDEIDSKGKVYTVVLIGAEGRFEEIIVEEKPDVVMEKIREVTL